MKIFLQIQESPQQNNQGEYILDENGQFTYHLGEAYFLLSVLSLSDDVLYTDVVSKSALLAGLEISLLDSEEPSFVKIESTENGCIKLGGTFNGEPHLGDYVAIIVQNPC